MPCVVASALEQPDWHECVVAASCGEGFSDRDDFGVGRVVRRVCDGSDACKAPSWFEFSLQDFGQPDVHGQMRYHVKC